MYVFCLKSKYGYCKYEKECDKIHLQMNVNFLKNVQRNIVTNDTPSYAITLKNTRDVNLAYTVSTSMLQNYKIQLKKKNYDICEEVKKLKAKVFTLKDNVTKMASALEKLKASENTIVEVITDKESEEQVEPIVVKEKKAKKEGHNDVEKAIGDNMVANRENENMNLADIISENSWFMCDKCEYKSKRKKRLKNTL